MIGIIYLKRFNDKDRNLTSDNIIKIEAKVCKDNLCRNDVIRRYKGKEFIIYIIIINLHLKTCNYNHLKIIYM
ncbi:diguanylate cyclase [Clostridium puniceum]|uniref:diguanylate cyclase n=1 Tax=Clostridium puniceum TaxID=29367 RepID=UPI0011782650